MRPHQGNTANRQLPAQSAAKRGMVMSQSTVNGRSIIDVVSPAVIRNAILKSPAENIGYTSPSSVHSDFVTLQRMAPEDTPEELKFALLESRFGLLIMASDAVGVCHIAFADDKTAARENLQRTYPNARLVDSEDTRFEKLLALFESHWNGGESVVLHVPGTPFQLKVWQALLNIPKGRLSTYGQIAKNIGKPSAARAVGTAIGANKVAFFIPCHRVVRGNGEIGGFMWGPDRKAAMIAWELEAGNAEFV